MGIDLDGSSAYLNCGNVLQATASMTASAWIRRDATGARHEIFSKEGSGNGWEMSVLDSGVVEFGVFNTTYPNATGTTTIGAGTIYHVCGVRDFSGGLLRVYVNGVQEGTAALGVTPADSTVDFNIGRRPNGTRYFNGVIEDARIYNRALSAAEVQELYLARGRDKIINGLQARWKMDEYPPSTLLTGGGGSFSILNYQNTTTWGGSFTSMTLAYTVPSGLSNPILVVCGGAESSSFTNAQPSACSFGATGMTKHVGTNTTATYGAGTAIFTLAVSADDSETITLTFPGTIGDGNTGGTIHAFVVEGGLATINTSTSAFNNAGNASASFTTSAASKLGITHHLSGDLEATTGATGTGHTLIGENVANGASSGFSSRIGYFNAATAGSYAGMGFSFGSGPNRSAMSMIALDLNPTSGADFVHDHTISGFDATPVGSIVSAESIGAF